MKKFITIWIGCSLSLAVGALAAQQEDAQSTPSKKQHSKAHSAQATQPLAGQPAHQAPAAKLHGGKRAGERGAAPANLPHAQSPASPGTDTNANSNAAMKTQQKQNRKKNEATAESVSNARAPEAANLKTKPQSVATTTAATSEQASRTNTAARKPNAQVKKIDVQKIKTQHTNFRAQPKPEQVPAVTFNESRQISGSDHWQGTQYTVFRSYHPQRHDQNWYRSHYNRIELIAGGYYFFNAGYWYPAWGYQPTAQYYAYDGPIYAGSGAEPPDRVIADVQAALQEMGYYRGEVDGLLGPLTREALTAYQTDNGLYTTAAIDEPTLNALGI